MFCRGWASNKGLNVPLLGPFEHVYQGLSYFVYLSLAVIFSIFQFSFITRITHVEIFDCQ